MVHVKLLDDLMRYDNRLTVGQEGYTIDTIPDRGDAFATVRFNNGACLDVLWKGLEIIDKEYLEERKEKENSKREALKKAKNVQVKRGPRGGFKYISYEYELDGKRHSNCNGNRIEGEELCDFFKSNGIEVKEI